MLFDSIEKVSLHDNLRDRRQVCNNLSSSPHLTLFFRYLHDVPHVSFALSVLLRCVFCRPLPVLVSLIFFEWPSVNLADRSYLYMHTYGCRGAATASPSPNVSTAIFGLRLFALCANGRFAKRLHERHYPTRGTFPPSRCRAADSEMLDAGRILLPNLILATLCFLSSCDRPKSFSR